MAFFKVIFIQLAFRVVSRGQEAKCAGRELGTCGEDHLQESILA